MKRLKFKVIAIVPLVSIGLAASANSDVSGIWMTAEKDALVNIRTCGTGFCGFVAGIIGTEKPQVDAEVLSVVCNAQIVGDLRKSGKKRRYSGGWIFDDETQKQYPLTAYLSADGNVLKLDVYGEKFNWTRAGDEKYLACK